MILIMPSRSCIHQKEKNERQQTLVAKSQDVKRKIMSITEELRSLREVDHD